MCNLASALRIYCIPNINRCVCYQFYQFGTEFAGSKFNMCLISCHMDKVRMVIHDEGYKIIWQDMTEMEDFFFFDKVNLQWSLHFQLTKGQNLHMRERPRPNCE